MLARSALSNKNLVPFGVIGQASRALRLCWEIVSGILFDEDTYVERT
jgi:hypothetical protein